MASATLQPGFGYVITTELVWRQRKNGAVSSAELGDFCDFFGRTRGINKSFARAGSNAVRAATTVTHPDVQVRQQPH